ncbi:MAG: hypothetical protein Q8K24_08720 [Hydrogenophaga sp.]|nr:hypothetical protein [Hydrogenophaga sp.]
MQAFSFGSYRSNQPGAVRSFAKRSSRCDERLTMDPTTIATMQVISSHMKKLVFWAFLLALVTLSMVPTAYLAAPVFSIWDKAQHAFGFAVLTLLAVQAYPSHSQFRLAMALLLLGGAIEIAQSASGWRMGDWRDGLANAVGIAVVMMFVRRRARFESKAA